MYKQITLAFMLLSSMILACSEEYDRIEINGAPLNLKLESNESLSYEFIAVQDIEYQIQLSITNFDYLSFDRIIINCNGSEQEFTESPINWTSPVSDTCILTVETDFEITFLLQITSYDSYYVHHDISEIEIVPLYDGLTFTYNKEAESMQTNFAFRVIDQAGDMVAHLNKSHFSFTEDNNMVNPDDFEDKSAQFEIPIALVMNNSYSIVEAELNDTVRNGFTKFIALTEDRSAEYIYYRFANDAQALDDINNITYGPDEKFISLYDALELAILDSIRDQSQRVLLVYTKGDDNHSLNSKEEVIKLIHDYRVPIFIITSEQVDKSIMSELSTYGQAFYSDNSSALFQNFIAAAKALSSFYKVSYWSPYRSGEHNIRFSVNVNDAEDSLETSFEVPEQ